jgi:hypothetical protein
MCTAAEYGAPAGLVNRGFLITPARRADTGTCRTLQLSRVWFAMALQAGFDLKCENTFLI